MTIASFSSQPEAGAQPLSDFEKRELLRRRIKVAALDAIAERRAHWVEVTRYYAEQVQRLLGTLVAQRGRVLEVGCGLGDLLAALPCGPGSVGVDISSRMIELARERHPGLDLRVADVEHDPLPEGPFDTV